MLHTSYIGIGSNLGDRVANIRRALESLGRHDGISVDAVSDLRETEAVIADGSDSAGAPDPGQPRFINAAARLSTSLAPQDLLRALSDVEKELGRPHPRPKGQARAIDLDMLFYDEMVLATPALVIPHPEVAKRLFVLTPLCDIAPSLVHPVTGLTVSDLERHLLKSTPCKPAIRFGAALPGR